MEDVALLTAGQQPSLATWEARAAAVLRKAGRLDPDAPDSAVWDELTHTTLDGIGVPVLGTPDTVVGLPATGVPGAAPFTRGGGPRGAEGGWDVRTTVSDPDADRAAEQILGDLENGATSVWLTVGAAATGVADLGQVLDGVLLEAAAVVLEPDEPVAAAERLTRLLTERGVTAAPGTNLGADPLGRAVRASSSVDVGDVDGVVRRIAELAIPAGVLGFVVDATALHDLGCSDAQEIGYATAAGVAYLRLLTGAGLDVDTAASLLEFRFAATDEQVPTVAKLRAARFLWHRVTELSGVPEAARRQRQHAVTSRPMMTRYDPWVNMLRTTVATFAAGIGGADAVTVLPFDIALGIPDAFARRIARNTSSVLVAESHVGRVADPAGGAYAVERLTADLAGGGWVELGRIEESGGVLAALGDGSLRSRVDDVRARRVTEVATRRRALTGVSEFPLLGEQLLEREPHADGAAPVHSYAEPFEAMRDEPAGHPVFLATMGSVAAHTARAGFAANLLAAGGVVTKGAGATSGVEDVLSAYAGQGVVCLCGTDRAYDEWGADLAEALRNAGARYLMLAGKPRGALAAAVDDSAAVGVDALAFLGRVRRELAR